MRSFATVALGIMLLVGCGGEPAAELGRPDGWEGTETRWWRAGADTASAYRDLESMPSMGLADDDVTYAANRQIAAQSGVARQQFERAVQQSLIALFRNNPEVVDSLFTRFVAPKLDDVSLSGDFSQQVENFKREGYRTIARHFREPRTTLSLGTDVPVPYPDSLRTRGIEGAVRTQVYISAEGEPLAIALLDGVHPVLDDIAMRATTQMRWQPAYLLRGGKARPIPSWARFSVRFSAPGS